MASPVLSLLQPAVQQYAWGKIGTASTVARLRACSDPSWQPEDTQPYAELWMGTHPNGPSQIQLSDNTSTDLGEWIHQHSDVLGQRCRETFGSSELPFLLKVLSVNRALSIQAHPDKARAQRLHASDPQHYKDANHKPELAIAVTRFEALSRFRPFAEIVDFVQSVPELHELVGTEVAKAFTSEPSATTLQQLFTAIMTATADTIEPLAANLVQRLQRQGASNGGDGDGDTTLASLVLRLNETYPGDVGLFVPFLLNHFTLEPGQAIYLAPNEPHAYLYGDCIECMARSDNVVRAGLTPKFKDVNVLCEMLTYVACESPLHEPIVEDSVYQRWAPPVPEFEVGRITLEPGAAPYDVKPLDSPCIWLVLSGSADVNGNETFSSGCSYFTAADAKLQLSATGSTPLVVYRASIAQG